MNSQESRAGHHQPQPQIHSLSHHLHHQQPPLHGHGIMAPPPHHHHHQHNSYVLPDNVNNSASSMMQQQQQENPRFAFDYTDGSSPRASGFNIEPARKKRGRPRKYSPDGNIALGLSPTPVTPISSSAVHHTDSAGSAPTPSSDNSSKKLRGRPPTPGKKQLDALGVGGVGFTPHVIVVNVGEDIASKLMAFSEQGPRTVCILSAHGAICNVTLRQPAMGGSTVAYEPLDKPVPNATLQVTGAVGWRREGLIYKKNEVFLDIVESVNLLMSSKGSVLRCDVTGKVLMKCFLSGMPDLKLGLNDKIGLEKESQLKSRPTKSGKTIELDDVTFHQCVNLTRFNSEKTVSFVPPDGEFELMKYRITEGVNLPFRVLPTIKELGRTRMEVNVKVKSVFGAKMFALGVVIKIPVPKQTAKASFQVTSGRAKYNPSIDSLVWKIKKFPGQTESTLSAEVELISTIAEKKSWTRPPIQMEFQVPMFTASGLRVRFLKVWEKSGYNTVEWVRYITKAGSYEIRC